MTADTYYKQARQIWLKYENNKTLNHLELRHRAECITSFLKEFSEKNFTHCKINGKDRTNLDNIRSTLEYSAQLESFSQVDNYFRELSTTQIGVYFIKYFINDNLTDLSKEDFYKLNDISDEEDLT